MLVGRRPAELARIDQLFKAKFPGSNWGIEQEMRQELSGVELAEGLDLLRPNKGTFSNKVQEIHRNIVEMHQWSGRSALEIERDIHDDFSAMSKSSFDQIDFEYRNFYGVSVRDAIMNDSKLSKSLKQEFAIESKGYENITEADKSELTRFAKDRDRKFSDKAQSDKNWEEATKAFGDGVQRGLEQGTRRNQRGPHEANGI